MKQTIATHIILAVHVTHVGAHPLWPFPVQGLRWSVHTRNQSLIVLLIFIRRAECLVATFVNGKQRTKITRTDIRCVRTAAAIDNTNGSVGCVGHGLCRYDNWNQTIAERLVVGATGHPQGKAVVEPPVHRGDILILNARELRRGQLRYCGCRWRVNTDAL